MNVSLAEVLYAYPFRLPPGRSRSEPIELVLRLEDGGPRRLTVSTGMERFIGYYPPVDGLETAGPCSASGRSIPPEGAAVSTGVGRAITDKLTLSPSARRASFQSAPSSGCRLPRKP